MITRQVHHLGRRVDDLLDVSRVARGLISLSKRPTELESVITRALEMASPLLEERRHHVTMNVPRTGLSVNADPDRLAQVFANLFTNAAKYTEPGGSVEVSAARHGETLVSAVRDTGVGMSAELLARVFEPFVQGAQGMRGSSDAARGRDPRAGMARGRGLRRAAGALDARVIRAGRGRARHRAAGDGRLRARRADPRASGGAAPRLLAVTGYGQEEDRRHTAEAGFEHHLVKPVSTDVLPAAMNGMR
ncbi:hybrid sensor histidine kinase/response regulator [Polyangium mundeleinium]|uniref:Hybrid sensor histidine kinase/response regulator n=1 Tax=Polyangium mundeleinium TaxID=2995306 RepID=A0ABT5F2E0_9BACT|nr:hybrid sensor histidine kinase/response regulator [Polyangium mundeleinium]MDC0748264.1 hybrid sensor histidine kinase/response regulator [Polyangium mundeleinium]